jgi:hypothetical protein
MPAHTKFEGATVTVSLSFRGDLIERRLVPQADATRVAVLMLAARRIAGRNMLENIGGAELKTSTLFQTIKAPLWVPFLISIKTHSTRRSIIKSFGFSSKKELSRNSRR